MLLCYNTKKKINFIKISFRLYKSNPKFFFNILNKILFGLKFNKIVKNNFSKSNIIFKIIKIKKNKSINSIIKKDKYKSIIENLMHVYIFIPKKFSLKNNSITINNNLISFLSFLKKYSLNVDNINISKLDIEEYEEYISQSNIDINDIYRLQLKQNNLIIPSYIPNNWDPYIITDMIYKNAIFNKISGLPLLEIIDNIVFESTMVGLSYSQISTFINNIGYKLNFNIKIDFTYFENIIREKIKKTQKIIKKNNLLVPKLYNSDINNNNKMSEIGNNSEMSEIGNNSEMSEIGNNSEMSDNNVIKTKKIYKKEYKINISYEIENIDFKNYRNSIEEQIIYKLSKLNIISSSFNSNNIKLVKLKTPENNILNKQNWVVSVIIPLEFVTNKKINLIKNIIYKRDLILNIAGVNAVPLDLNFILSSMRKNNKCRIEIELSPCPEGFIRNKEYNLNGIKNGDCIKV